VASRIKGTGRHTGALALKRRKVGWSRGEIARKQAGTAPGQFQNLIKLKEKNRRRDEGPEEGLGELRVLRGGELDSEIKKWGG